MQVANGQGAGRTHYHELPSRPTPPHQFDAGGSNLSLGSPRYMHTCSAAPEIEEGALIKYDFKTEENVSAQK